MTVWTPDRPATPRPLTLDVPRPADARVLAWSAVAAVLTDLTIRSGVVGPAGALLVATVSVAMIASGRLWRPQAVTAALAAPIFGTWLVVRSSPWLVVPDAAAVVLLVVAAASLQGGGDLFDLDLPAWLHRAGLAFVHGLAAPAFLSRGLRRPTGQPTITGNGTERLTGILRGLAVALPVVLVLGALLSSADPVFASLFRLRLDTADLAAHLILFGFGAWVMGGLFRLTSFPSPPTLAGRRRRLGVIEVLVVLVAIDVMFALFVVAQLLAAAGAEGHVLRTHGLTYADYARSGYFQLLWVAALTLGLLLILEVLVGKPAGSSRRWFALGACIADLLTLGIVIVALRRLALYEHAYGLTMLRLASQVFAVWIVVVFALLFVALVGGWRRRQWFLAAAMGAGLGLLLAFNVANPEAFVARHDLANPSRADAGYLAGLSDDAVPTITARLALLGPAEATALVSAMCKPASRWHGWAAFNLSKSHANKARHLLCPRAPRSG